MHRIVVIVVAVVLLLGVGVGSAKNNVDVSELQALDEPASRFDVTLVRPGVDLATYSRLQTHEVDLEYRKDERGATRSATGNILGSKSNALPRPSHKEAVKFKEIVGKAVSAELSEESVLARSEGEEDRTLLVNCTYTDMVFTAPKKVRKGDPPMQLVADGTLVFDLVDAETGEVQLRLSERRRIVHVSDGEPAKGKPDVWADVKTWARRAAADLRDELQRIGVQEQDS